MAINEEEDRRRVPWTRDDGREVERTEMRCPCGEWLLLARNTNTCECGADYNMSGQRLAPREQWGEETGETAVDIINHDGYSGVDY